MEIRPRPNDCIALQTLFDRDNQIYDNLQYLFDAIFENVFDPTRIWSPITFHLILESKLALIDILQTLCPRLYDSGAAYYHRLSYLAQNSNMKQDYDVYQDLLY